MQAIYFITLGPYALLAAGFIVCLCVLLAFKNEIRRLRSRLAGRESPSPGGLSPMDVKLRLDEMLARLREAEDRTGMLVAPAPSRSGLNLSRRSQVIRMSRRGERAENIAATLSLPRREVELLLKVHGLILNGTGDATS